MGTSTGKVGIFDIFFTEEINLSPVLYIDSHKASIETLSIYENHYLIISSSDGMISFTDVSPVKLRNAFKSVTTNIDTIDPNFLTTMKQYYGSIKKGVDKFNRKYISSVIMSLKNNKKFNMRKDSSQSFNNQYNNTKRKKSFAATAGESNALNVFFIQFLPTSNIKSFSKLKRIVPVILLDLFDFSCNNESKTKNKEILI